MNDSEKTSLKMAVIKSMNDLKIGQVFSGLEFQKMVAGYYPKARRKYTETILRVARKYCRDKYRCVKRTESKYERI